MCKSPSLAEWRLLRRYVSACLHNRFRRKPPFELDHFEHCLYCRVPNMTRQYAGMRTLITIHSRHTQRSHAAARDTQDALVFDLNRLQESIDLPDHIIFKNTLPVGHAFLHATFLHGRVKGRDHVIAITKV